MEILGVVFAYFTPETTLPVVSAVAASLGFVLMIARSPVRFAREGLRRAVKGVRAVIVSVRR